MFLCLDSAANLYLTFTRTGLSLFSASGLGCGGDAELNGVIFNMMTNCSHVTCIKMLSFLILKVSIWSML